jgi:anthrone oxygenase-like protein
VVLLLIATAATGLFAGAAIYVSGVEHPARVSCGTEAALREFGPSYPRGAIMQASLAVMGCVAGLVAGWQQRDWTAASAAVLLGSLVPFTLIVILPTNKRLLDPALKSQDVEAARLLARWGRLHAVRTLVSTVAFAMFLTRFGGAAG